MNQSNNLHIIIGLGLTGFSCVQFLSKRNIPVAVIDTRANPPCLKQLQEQYPDVPIYLQNLNHPILKQASQIILSPGIAREKILTQDTPICGDIELFARYANAPIVAITGTNGKSTVTTLVAEMAKEAGLQVAVGGNLGVPALALLADAVQLYVLELSSFQLETTTSLHTDAACILNISADHLDRYTNLSAYQQVKQRIYTNCNVAIYNRDDILTTPKAKQPCLSFGLQEPATEQFGLRQCGQEWYLAYGQDNLLAVNQLRIYGRQNWANALAALAIGHAIHLPMQAMLKTLRHYPGLEHRCQWVRELNGVRWYNDSKGTNVGATCAAINGLSETARGKIILLAGGQGKQADFSLLQQPVQRYVKEAILYGEDGAKIAATLAGYCALSQVNTLAQAIKLARRFAKAGDIVLLSPACASFDMFDNFAHRGQVFTQMVRELNAN